MSLTADYVRRAKAHFGGESMSDRELREHIGSSGPVVSQARYGSMSDPVAIRIARALQIDAGEVIMVARAEREKDPEGKAELEAYMSKTLAAVPKKTARVERGGMAAMVDQLGVSRTRRRAAAVVLSVSILAGAGAPSPAEAVTTGANCSTLCIMSSREDSRTT